MSACRLTQSEDRWPDPGIWARELIEAADAEIAAREEPATDAQVREIWRLWGQLPAEWCPAERASFLVDSELPVMAEEDASESAGDRAELHPGIDVYRQFIRAGVHLPLGARYQRSVDAAYEWASLVESYETSSAIRTGVIHAAWRWLDPLSQPMHRLAVTRAVNELAVERKGPIFERAPGLRQIRTLRDRVEAYLAARVRALTMIQKEMDRLIPDGPEVARLRRCPKSWTKRKDVDRAWFLAALQTFGLCSPERWRACLASEIPRLSGNARRRFDALVSSEEGLRAGSTLPLRVWLADNAPVVIRFGFRKDTLFAHAGKLGILKSTNDSDVSRWNLGFSFRRGRPAHDERTPSGAILALLSPAPLLVMD